VNLTWSPPECGMHGSYLYYPRLDDTPETFFSAPPGSNIWVGTLFTVQNSCHLQDAKLWFHDHPQNGWDYLTLDVFDGTHTLIGSSDPFQPCSNDWMYVPLFGTVVEGDFFIMVHWDSATNPTHELGHDESNSDWAWEDYSWYFDGTTWSTYSSVVGCDTGVFFLRARVFNPDDKKSGELNNGHDLTCDASESMSLTGFDIYRTDESGLPPYSRLNLDPLSDTGYVDILPPGITSGSFRYYVTSVFHDPLTSLFICESSSDTILVDPYTGIYPLRQSILQMWPNPTTGNLSFLSKDPVKCVSLISALGIIYSCPIIKEDNCIYHIDISRHPSGIYLLHVATESGSIIEKVVKL